MEKSPQVRRHNSFAKFYKNWKYNQPNIQISQLYNQRNNFKITPLWRQTICNAFCPVSNSFSPACIYPRHQYQLQSTLYTAESDVSDEDETKVKQRPPSRRKPRRETKRRRGGRWCIEAAKRPNEGEDWLGACGPPLPASIRRHTEECARVHTATRASVPHASVHRRRIASIVFHRVGGLAKMAVYAAETWRKRQKPGARPRPKGPSVSGGPATINDRRAKIVLCFHLELAAILSFDLPASWSTPK